MFKHELVYPRPWLHMLTLRAHLKPGDREKHGWNSSGVVKKTIKKSNKSGEPDRVSVSLANTCLLS